ncbi:DUF5324 family protein [Streptomyces johnsoniae]|uniref:DUF5324 family protein n=1 Tax=Streptomyces johnsoniae TaxID=3075532 RepID=A0ABU2SAW2_9ACTN|nr:DUF5324 family protein [Streptomyces sp. DSM 41886]MDT0445938.1 DUF5324 family protein [Streptomyces sp. DSM 41886]
MSHNGKSGVRHATDMVTPYAATAKDNAVHYAHQAGTYLKPRAHKAASEARLRYATQVVPRVARARAAAGPARDEASARSAAALAALRGDITPREIACAVRRRERRRRTGRMARRIGLLTLVAGGAFAAWRWWSGQTNPDWLMEPSPATEVTPSSPGTAEETETEESTAG